MTLDVKIMEKLDGLARSTSRDADHEALCLVNNLKFEPPQPHLKAAYVKYYFQSKKDYREGKEEHEHHHPKGYGHGV